MCKFKFYTIQYYFFIINLYIYLFCAFILNVFASGKHSLTLYGAGKIAYGEKTHHAYVFFYVTSPHFKVKIIEISNVDINSVSEGKAPKVYGVNQNYAVIPKDKTWYSYWGLPDKEVKCPKDFDEIEVYLEP